MKKNEFKEKSSEQLKSTLNMFKVLVIFLVIVLLFLVGVCVYGLLMKEDKSTFIALIAVASGASITLIAPIVKMKEIKFELRMRKENN
jgi:membrane protein YdbS with pleckstrin-like domain